MISLREGGCGCSLRGMSHIRISEVARDQPEGGIVPHRNRTRVLGGLLCAFYNGRDARCASCGRDVRHPDKGRNARWASFAAKMAAFPVRPRQAWSLPWRRGRSPRPTGGCSPYTGIAFSLHGESRLPTRRVWVSYTAKRSFLHGTSHI